jgi:hypothetical protein
LKLTRTIAMALGLFVIVAPLRRQESKEVVKQEDEIRWLLLLVHKC